MSFCHSCAATLAAALFAAGSAAPSHAEPPAAKRFEIVSPESGARVRPGDTLTVRVRVEQGLDPATGVLVLTSADAVRFKGPPYEWRTKVPQSHAPGPFAISAAVISTSGKQLLTDEVSVLVEVPTALRLIEVEPRHLVLSGPYSPSDPESQDSLRVVGVYEDGVRRDLTRSPVARYESADERVARVFVADWPWIRGAGPGKTRIAVQVGPHEVRVPVEVRSVNSRPVAATMPPPRGGATELPPVVVGSPVRLDGGKSYDPDREPLSVRWSVSVKPAGSRVEIPRPERPVVEIVPDRPGQYVFVLAVRDASGGKDEGRVAVVAALPFSPKQSLLSVRPSEDAGGPAYLVTATILDEQGRPVVGEPVALDHVLEGVLGSSRVPWNSCETHRSDAEGKAVFPVSLHSGMSVKLAARVGGCRGFESDKTVVVGEAGAQSRLSERPLPR